MAAPCESEFAPGTGLARDKLILVRLQTPTRCVTRRQMPVPQPQVAHEGFRK
jgi:hypothetical protein